MCEGVTGSVTDEETVVKAGTTLRDSKRRDRVEKD